MKRCICLLLCFSFLLLLGGCSEPSYEEVQTAVDQDRLYLLTVIDYLAEICDENESITWHLDDPSHGSPYPPSYPKYSDILSALEHLQNRGYSLISKRRNTVKFILWNRLSDVACGIAYSIDGNEIDIEYLTESVPLLEENWYYYVADFNQWRARRTSQNS